MEFVQRGGRGQAQNPNFLIFIFAVLQSKYGDSLGRLIPIFGSKIQGGGGGQQKVWTKSILSFFIFFWLSPLSTIVNYDSSTLLAVGKTDKKWTLIYISSNRIITFLNKSEIIYTDVILSKLFSRPEKRHRLWIRCLPGQKGLLY